MIKEGKHVTAGNASQLSDGASACVLMEAKGRATRCATLALIARSLGGHQADEMGIGPVFAIPKLLEKNGLTMDDIGLWELTKHLLQVVYCRTS